METELYVAHYLFVHVKIVFVGFISQVYIYINKLYGFHCCIKSVAFVVHLTLCFHVESVHIIIPKIKNKLLEY